MAVDESARALRRSHFAACVLYTMNAVVFIIVLSLQPVQGYPACVSTYTRSAGITTHCAYPSPSAVSAGFLTVLAVCHGLLALFFGPYWAALQQRTSWWRPVFFGLAVGLMVAQTSLSASVANVWAVVLVSSCACAVHVIVCWRFERENVLAGPPSADSAVAAGTAPLVQRGGPGRPRDERKTRGRSQAQWQMWLLVLLSLLPAIVQVCWQPSETEGWVWALVFMCVFFSSLQPFLHAFQFSYGLFQAPKHTSSSLSPGVQRFVSGEHLWVWFLFLWTSSESLLVLLGSLQ